MTEDIMSLILIHNEKQSSTEGIKYLNPSSENKTQKSVRLAINNSHITRYCNRNNLRWKKE